jgi:hypothetical protein
MGCEMRYSPPDRSNTAPPKPRTPSAIGFGGASARSAFTAACMDAVLSFRPVGSAPYAKGEITPPVAVAAQSAKESGEPALARHAAMVRKWRARAGCPAGGRTRVRSLTGKGARIATATDAKHSTRVVPTAAMRIAIFFKCHFPPVLPHRAPSPSSPSLHHKQPVPHELNHNSMSGAATRTELSKVHAWKARIESEIGSQLSYGAAWGSLEPDEARRVGRTIEEDIARRERELAEAKAVVEARHAKQSAAQAPALEAFSPVRTELDQRLSAVAGRFKTRGGRR